MKKRARDKWIKLPPLSIFVEDVERVVQLMAEAGCEVHIDYPGFRLSSADELLQLATETGRRNIAELRLWTPKISVNFDSWTSQLHVADDEDALSVGIAEKIRNHLNQRRKFFTPVRFYALAIVTGNAVLWVPITSRWFDLSAGTALVIVAFVAFKYDWPPACQINLTRRASAQSFFEKHAAQIGVALIGAVAGAVATALISRLF